MKNFKWNRSLVWQLLNVGVGLVFVYASFYKIRHPGAFAEQIYNFKLLPSFLINPSAIVLPWIQLLAGLCLVLHRFRLGAIFLITSMMVVFQAAVASALIRGLNISCGCFETGGNPVTWWVFGRDSLILIAAVVVFVRIWNAHSQES